MADWRRPHGTSGFTIMGGVNLVGFGLFAFTGLVGVASGRWAWHGWYLLLVVPIALTWRMMLIDLYVGDRGLRVRTFWRTRTVPWSDVAGFEVRPGTRLGDPGSHPAIWINLRESGAIETPVIQVSEARIFLPRWTRGPVDLPPKEFDQCVASLRDRLGTRRT
jgi:hypothetical protein